MMLSDHSAGVRLVHAVTTSCIVLKYIYVYVL